MRIIEEVETDKRCRQTPTAVTMSGAARFVSEFEACHDVIKNKEEIPICYLLMLGQVFPDYSSPLSYPILNQLRRVLDSHQYRLCHFRLRFH